MHRHAMAWGGVHPGLPPISPWSPAVRFRLMFCRDGLPSSSSTTRKRGLCRYLSTRASPLRVPGRRCFTKRCKRISAFSASWARTKSIALFQTSSMHNTFYRLTLIFSYLFHPHASLSPTSCAPAEIPGAPAGDPPNLQDSASRSSRT